MVIYVPPDRGERRVLRDTLRHFHGIGAIPAQLAAMMQTNINVQSLTVEAALTGKKEHVYQAAMFDPHTAAELTLDEIWSLVDELIAAHGDYIPPLH